MRKSIPVVLLAALVFAGPAVADFLEPDARHEFEIHPAPSRPGSNGINLVVSDQTGDGRDSELRGILSKYLTDEGFTVTSDGTGSSVKFTLTDYSYIDKDEIDWLWVAGGCLFGLLPAAVVYFIDESNKTGTIEIGAELEIEGKRSSVTYARVEKDLNERRVLDEMLRRTIGAMR